MIKHHDWLNSRFWYDIWDNSGLVNLFTGKHIFFNSSNCLGLLRLFLRGSGSLTSPAVALRWSPGQVALQGNPNSPCPGWRSQREDSVGELELVPASQVVWWQVMMIIISKLAQNIWLWLIMMIPSGRGSVNSTVNEGFWWDNHLWHYGFSIAMTIMMTMLLTAITMIIITVVIYCWEWGCKTTCNYQKQRTVTN